MHARTGACSVWPSPRVELGIKRSWVEISGTGKAMADEGAPRSTEGGPPQPAGIGREAVREAVADILEGIPSLRRLLESHRRERGEDGTASIAIAGTSGSSEGVSGSTSSSETPAVPALVPAPATTGSTAQGTLK